MTNTAKKHPLPCDNCIHRGVCRNEEVLSPNLIAFEECYPNILHIDVSCERFRSNE